MLLKNVKLLKLILKYIGLFLSLIVFLSGLLFMLVYLGAFGKLPDKVALSSIRNEEASLVFSADEVLIGKFFAQNRTNISWDEIPEHLVDALIATEDRRFFSHKGYDARSYLRVFLKSIMRGDKSGGGGSTLTQQLIKNLYGRSKSGFLNLPVNKIKEVIIASRIEAVYSKEELVLLYLNSVPFGEDVYGVETATHRFFNKTTRELRIEESAVLVGMLKANTFFNPRLNPVNSLDRRNLVLSLMEKEHFLLPGEADSLQKLPLSLDYENVGINQPAGYFVHQVRSKVLDLLDEIRMNSDKEYDLEKDGLKIYTTLNMQVQEMAEGAINSHLTVMQKLLDKELAGQGIKKQYYNKQKQASTDAVRDQLPGAIEVFEWDGIRAKNISKLDSLWHYYKMLNAAVLITNPVNGTVIVWIGGNDFRTMPFDMVLSHRQIASAFKPILYATAIENGDTPCTYLENEGKNYPEYEGWEPRNFDYTSTPDSTVALWYALAHSMNLPTVDLYFKVGREKLMNTCRKLGFPSTSEDAPSVALGSLDLSLAEIVKAYASFANGGKLNELVMIDKITDAGGNILYQSQVAEPVRIFSPETSQTITAILQTAIDQGTGARIRSQYGIQADLAGKTGTAQNNSDAWFIAYTPNLVLGTWVGARTPDVHFYSKNGTGSALALPVVAMTLKGIEKDAVLRKQYLTKFSISGEVYSTMQCEPYYKKGVDGFLDRLFKPKSKKNNKDKNKGGFFKRLFQGKK
jgi:penicillin-binding protein 1A